VSRAKTLACLGYFLLSVPFSPAVIAGYLLAGLSWIFLNTRLGRRIFFIIGIYFVSTSAILAATYLLTKLLHPIRALNYLYEEVAIGVSYVIAVTWIIKLCLEIVSFRTCGKILFSRLFKVAGIIALISLTAILTGYFAPDFDNELLQRFFELVYAIGLTLALVNNIIAGVAFIKAKIPFQKTALNTAEEMSYCNVHLENSSSDKSSGSTWVYS